MLLSNIGFLGRRDYYLALFGKFFVIAGACSLSNYRHILYGLHRLERSGVPDGPSPSQNIGLQCSQVASGLPLDCRTKVGREAVRRSGAAIVLAITARSPLRPVQQAMIVAATISAFRHAIVRRSALDVGELLRRTRHA